MLSHLIIVNQSLAVLRFTSILNVFRRINHNHNQSLVCLTPDYRRVDLSSTRVGSHRSLLLTQGDSHRTVTASDTFSIKNLFQFLPVLAMYPGILKHSHWLLDDQVDLEWPMWGTFVKHCLSFNLIVHGTALRLRNIQVRWLLQMYGFLWHTFPVKRTEQRYSINWIKGTFHIERRCVCIRGVSSEWGSVKSWCMQLRLRQNLACCLPTFAAQCQTSRPCWSRYLGNYENQNDRATITTFIKCRLEYGWSQWPIPWQLNVFLTQHY